MANHDEDFYYDVAMKLTLEAGHVLKGATFARKTVTEKLGDWDLVTEYDRKIEDIIVGKLRQQFPDHKFIGEESTGKNLPELTDDPTWIIDPIDGTTNFIHNFPQICVVIGLSINKEMRIGIVYNPVLEQLFAARKGRGSFLNGRPLKTSTVDDISKALIAIEPEFMKVDDLKEKMIERIKILGTKTHGIRTIGSAAITLCHIALGAIEGYQIEGPGISTWDIAAASLIITEAGGVVIDRVTGNDVNIMNPRAIGACNIKIAQDLKKMINDADLQVQLQKN
ncbi:uncharacterized protein LOC130667584 [Microplitis mediator]|uniref:uncharacterized protein LOC130667584 n=1 Tax=Microplitis mediator TaxID=375433 RepID=UPI0025540DA3|nr:uncharacterized protein LOC130667584 [Microplitis mediator]